MRTAKVTLWLLIANTLFFLVAYPLAIIYGNNFLKFIALTPSDFVHGLYVWTLFTSMFMHGSLSHLFMNMLSLLFLGGFLERLIGSKRFAGIYFISGIIASLTFIAAAYLTGQDINVSAVGASGAIFGLAGMLAVLTPRMPVYLFFIPIAMPMWFGVILILVLMWLVSATLHVPIGNTAHLGGLIAGVVYALYLKNKYKHKARLIAQYYR